MPCRAGLVPASAPATGTGRYGLGLRFDAGNRGCNLHVRRGGLPVLLSLLLLGSALPPRVRSAAVPRSLFGPCRTASAVGPPSGIEGGHVTVRDGLVDDFAGADPAGSEALDRALPGKLRDLGSPRFAVSGGTAPPFIR